MNMEDHVGTQRLSGYDEEQDQQDHEKGMHMHVDR